MIRDGSHTDAAGFICFERILHQSGKFFFLFFIQARIVELKHENGNTARSTFINQYERAESVCFIACFNVLAQEAHKNKSQSPDLNRRHADYDSAALTN